MGGGGGGDIDVTDAVNQISEMVEVGLQFAEHQVQQGIRFGEDQLDKGIDYAEAQSSAAINELKTSIETGKAELREGFNRYQALNAPYRLASYNAMDGLMDTMGMARPNISSADMAKVLDNKAVQRGAQDRLRASGISMLNSLPAGLDPNIRQQIQYAVMSGGDPNAIASQLQKVMELNNLEFNTGRNQSERFKFLNSGVRVPTQEGEGGSSGGSGLGGMFGGSGGTSGSGSGGGGLSPNDKSPFNAPEYINPTRGPQAFNPINTYLANSLGAYQDLYRANMSMPYNQQGLSAALQNGMYSQQPKVVDIF